MARRHLYRLSRLSLGRGTSEPGQRRLAWPLRKDDTHKSSRVSTPFFCSTRQDKTRRAGAEGESNLKKIARNLGDAWAGRLAKEMLDRVGSSDYDFLKSVADGGDEDALIAEKFMTGKIAETSVGRAMISADPDVLPTTLAAARIHRLHAVITAETVKYVRGCMQTSIGRLTLQAEDRIADSSQTFLTYLAQLTRGHMWGGSDRKAPPVTSIIFLNELNKVKGIEPRYLPEQDTIVPFDGAPTPGAPPVTKGWVFPIVTPYHEANAQLADILDGWCKAVFGIDDYFGSIAMVLKETVQQLAIQREEEQQMWARRMSRLMAEQAMLAARGRFNSPEDENSRLQTVGVGLSKARAARIWFKKLCSTQTEETPSSPKMTLCMAIASVLATISGLIFGT